MSTASAKILETVKQQILFGSAKAARSLSYRRPTGSPGVLNEFSKAAKGAVLSLEVGVFD